MDAGEGCKEDKDKTKDANGVGRKEAEGDEQEEEPIPDHPSLEDFEDEASLNTLVFFIFLTCQKLELPITATALAATLLHRFQHKAPVKEFGIDPYHIATACIVLATKGSDCERKFRDILNCSHKTRYPSKPAMQIDDKYWEFKDAIVDVEQVVLRHLSFTVHETLPHVFLLNYVKAVGGDCRLASLATAILNNSYYTSLCLTYHPHEIAVGALFVAAHLLNYPFPATRTSTSKPWWEVFGTGTENLTAICNAMLSVFEAPPPVQARYIEAHFKLQEQRHQRLMNRIMRQQAVVMAKFKEERERQMKMQEEWARERERQREEWEQLNQPRVRERDRLSPDPDPAAAAAAPKPALLPTPPSAPPSAATSAPTDSAAQATMQPAAGHTRPLGGWPNLFSLGTTGTGVFAGAYGGAAQAASAMEGASAPVGDGGGQAGVLPLGMGMLPQQQALPSALLLQMQQLRQMQLLQQVQQQQWMQQQQLMQTQQTVQPQSQPPATTEAAPSLAHQDWTA